MDPAVSAFRVNENPGITAYARDSDLNLLLILKVFWWRFANTYSCPMTIQGGCYKWVSKSDELFNFPILNRAKIENNVHNIYIYAYKIKFCTLFSQFLIAGLKQSYNKYKFERKNEYFGYSACMLILMDQSTKL